MNVRTPTDDEIDRGAKALRERQMSGRITRAWGTVPKSEQKKWREYAEIVLRAALSSGEIQPMTILPSSTVTDDMVERAWAAIVGADVAGQCFVASLTRGDLRTGLEAASVAQLSLQGGLADNA